jgi:DNA repair exonuclease SbcCD nuclease subunit
VHAPGVRVLHVTDTHLGIVRPIRGGPPGWTRADDHLAALRAALRHGEESGCELVVHSGDLFDRSRPPRRAVLAAEALLREAARRVPVLLVPGNHDRRGLSRWLPHPDLRVHDRPARVVVRGLALGLVPFRPTAEAFAEAARPFAGVDALVAHQGFHGARVPGLVFTAGTQPDTVGAEHLPHGVRVVLCGHLHPRQVVRLGEAAVVQPGSTERTSWTERHEAKGWAVWEFGATATWRFVDGPARPMLDVDGPDDLARVVPGALVRARGVPEPEVTARGGWLVGPPPGVTPPPRSPHPRRERGLGPLFGG